MNNFIIWGATGHAIVLEELLREQHCRVIAFFDNNPAVKTPFDNIPLFHGTDGFLEWKKKETFIEETYYLVAIGGEKGEDRESVFKYLQNQGLKTKSVIHKTAYVAYNSIIGEGSQILAQSCVCARAILGKSVIVNTSASIDHEAILADFVHIAPGARLCGCVIVGKYSFIGANATVLPRIVIGENSIIGAGAVVTKNVPKNVIVYGNPAKIISQTQ